MTPSLTLLLRRRAARGTSGVQSSNASKAEAGRLITSAKSMVSTTSRIGAGTAAMLSGGQSGVDRIRSINCRIIEPWVSGGRPTSSSNARHPMEYTSPDLDSSNPSGASKEGSAISGAE